MNAELVTKHLFYFGQNLSSLALRIDTTIEIYCCSSDLNILGSLRATFFLIDDHVTMFLAGFDKFRDFRMKKNGLIGPIG